ncbi:MAG: hypothetical protein NTW35_02910 [Candidatus Nomurabacteria bacterium]|nr:hypothetical protein [Candidatus Nomurabacteria bacterium]
MPPIEVPENKIIQLPVKIEMPDEPELFNSVHANALDQRFGILLPNLELNGKGFFDLYKKIVIDGKIPNKIFEAYLKFKNIKKPETKKQIIRPPEFVKKDNTVTTPDFKKLAGNDVEKDDELVRDPNNPNQWIKKSSLEEK